MNLDQTLVLAIVSLSLAGLVAAVALVLPTHRITPDRRLQRVVSGESGLTRSARGATTWVTNVVASRPRFQKWAYLLDRAGVRRPLPEVILILGAVALAFFSLGFLLANAAMGLLLAIVAVIAAWLWVSLRAARRQAQFALQLDDLTQLLATNLRAGHSLLQALSALGQDLDEPGRTEIARAVNQVRVGRDLGEALGETALRMESDDFSWVAEAIAIHRQVGGNLADVLDTVGQTIRERGEIQRQVKALSAEGRMSAVVLMILPIAVGFMLSILNPVYLSTFTQTSAGWMMLGACVVLMVLGGLWLRKLIKVEF